MEILHTAEFESPIGPLRVASSERGLVYLELPRASGRGFRGWQRRHAPGAHCVRSLPHNQRAIAQILEYLGGERTDFELALDVRGTPFERDVYGALAAIPYGETRTYGEIARAVGRSGAFRAVGAANAANPIALVVPCHRVVRSGGRLGGYGGGLDLKQRLLAMEARPAADRLL